MRIIAPLFLSVDDRVRALLLATLYTQPTSLAIGAINGVASAGIAAYVSGSFLLLKAAVVLASGFAELDDAGRALLLEDLQSPCTEEVAVFHAFSRVVKEARTGFVVLDTAPTGHSLLLMDATGAYHRQMVRAYEGHGAMRVVTPLMPPMEVSV